MGLRILQQLRGGSFSNRIFLSPLKGWHGWRLILWIGWRYTDMSWISRSISIPDVNEYSWSVQSKRIIREIDSNTGRRHYTLRWKVQNCIYTAIPLTCPFLIKSNAYMPPCHHQTARDLPPKPCVQLSSSRFSHISLVSTLHVAAIRVPFITFPFLRTAHLVHRSMNRQTIDPTEATVLVSQLPSTSASSL